MAAKTVDKIISKTVVESKLATYTPSDGEVIIVKKTNGDMYLRVGDGVTAGGKPYLIETVAQLPAIPFSKLTSLPSTLAAHGITDGATIAALTSSPP